MVNCLVCATINSGGPCFYISFAKLLPTLISPWYFLSGLNLSVTFRTNSCYSKYNLKLLVQCKLKLSPQEEDSGLTLQIHCTVLVQPVPWLVPCICVWVVWIHCMNAERWVACYVSAFTPWHLIVFVCKYFCLMIFDRAAAAWVVALLTYAPFLWQIKDGVHGESSRPS